MKAAVAELGQYKITSKVPSENWCDVIFEPTGQEVLTIYTLKFGQRRGLKRGLSLSKEGHYVVVVDVPMITAELAAELVSKIFTKNKRQAGRLLD